MTIRMPVLCVVLLLAALTFPNNAAEAGKQPFQLADLLTLERLNDPQLSPDGKSVAYVQRAMSLEKNSGTSQIWLIPSSGGSPRQLTFHEKGATRPRRSPDGARIAFLSTRSGSQQIWSLPLDGGEARQLTSLSYDVDNHAWSPTGRHIAFTAAVFPDVESDSVSQAAKQKEVDESGVKAQIIDGLLYRHWSEWRHGKRTHTFVYSVEYGQARDLSRGDFEAPPFSLGGSDPFSFSPDGRTLVYTRGPNATNEAWSTDANLILADIGGEAGPNCITCGNTGWDGSPVFSPDGRLIAFRSQLRDGYEADKFRLAVYDRTSRKTTYHANGLDRWVEEILWSPDSKRIYFTVDDQASASLYEASLSDTNSVRKVLGGKSISSLTLAPSGDFMVGTVQSHTAPAEVMRIDLPKSTNEQASITILTKANEPLLSQRAMPDVSSVTYPGSSNAPIQAWLMKPPGFDKTKEYPFLLLIHGGPQGVWPDAFSYRWNGALHAARGYVVLMPNFHGSSSFGQPFTEQISGDWGGAAYEDLMKGVDWAIAEGLAKPGRIGAAGASFGGYMVNWILGHTDRFKVLVSHAGVYNLDSMYGTTEELWFPEWEFGGPPWKNRENYEKFSPHLFAGNFKTPTLVTHGELDFRVNIGEGLQLFTALQRQGVPSRFLYFPDEGHWILKPKNSKLWHETVFAWLDKYLKPSEE